MVRRAPTTTLFPYTTLFRSGVASRPARLHRPGTNYRHRQIHRLGGGADGNKTGVVHVVSAVMVVHLSIPVDLSQQVRVRSGHRPGQQRRVPAGGNSPAVDAL